MDSNVLFSLFIGAGYASIPVYFFLKVRRIAVLFLALSMGAASMLNCLLDLKGLLEPWWGTISMSALNGMFFFCMFIITLYLPPSSSYSQRSFKWLMLALGVGSFLWAAYLGLSH
jgi:hypothetical protein